MPSRQCVENRGLATLRQPDYCDIHTQLINLVVSQKDQLIALEQLTPFSVKGRVDTAPTFGLDPITVMVQV